MKVEEIITNKVLESLKQGSIPWKQPWLTAFPMNFVSKKEYQGINFFLLNLIAEEKHYKYPYYVTFKQASDLGGYVKKGEKSHLVVFYKRETVDEDEEDDKKEYRFLLRYYRVFNIEQCEGITVTERFNHKRDQNYEDVLEVYKDKPKIVEGNRASYSQDRDLVVCPVLSRFERVQDYYATLYHELIHSTGSTRRLNRFEGKDDSIFGSESYSKEELVAELGSAFLCARHKIDNRLVKNSVGYIQHWYKVLQGNPRMVITAASKAQKAVNYMSGVNSV